MLWWAASSLSRHSAPLLHGLPPRSASAAAATMLERHPRAHLGLRPTAAAQSLRHLSDFGVPVHRSMARWAPPTRPEGYSTSDGEADGPGSYLREDEEGEDKEAEEVLLEPMSVGDLATGKEWEGFMLEYDFGSDNDDEDSAEEEKK